MYSFFTRKILVALKCVGWAVLKNWKCTLSLVVDEGSKPSSQTYTYNISMVAGESSQLTSNHDIGMTTTIPWDPQLPEVN